MRLTLLAASLALFASSLTNATPIKPQNSSVSCISPSLNKDLQGEWKAVTVNYRAATTGVKQKFTRSSDLYLPINYRKGRNLSILLALHNSHSTGGKNFSITNDLVTLADKYNFVLLAPTGGVKYLDEYIGYTWNISFVPPQDQDSGQVNVSASLGAYDWPFIQALLTEVQSYPRVDKRKTFSMGFSGGGRFASSLACHKEASKQIAAIATLASLRAGPGDPSASPPYTEVLTRKIDTAPGRVPPNPTYPCEPSHGLGILAFHGTSDTTNPYDGNSKDQWSYTVSKAARRWVDLFGCDTTPPNATLCDSPNITKQTWSCPDKSRDVMSGAGINIYLVEGMGHIIPIDNATSPVGNNFHYQDKMWDFFQDYRTL